MLSITFYHITLFYYFHNIYQYLKLYFYLFTLHYFHGPNVCVSLQSPYVEFLIPKVRSSGDGAFGKWLGLDEVMRVGIS